MSAHNEARYQKLTQSFLEQMAEIDSTQEEYADGLKYALEEIEVSLQAAKETM